MNPIVFSHKNKDGLFEYHYSTGFFYPDRDERIIPADLSFSSHKNLWDDWCSKDPPSSSLEIFGISNHAVGENGLLYSLLVWWLSQSQKLLGVATWETDLILDSLEKEPDYINWEYLLTHEEEIQGDKLIDHGFSRAKSSISWDGDKKINKCPVNKTGIFTINDFNELVKLNYWGVDACFNANYYICENSNNLIKDLRSWFNPRKKVFKNCDIFISILAGQDLGFNDYIVIKSKRDLTQEIKDVTQRLNGFAKSYIERIQKVSLSEEMDILLADLIEEFFLFRYPSNNVK